MKSLLQVRKGQSWTKHIGEKAMYTPELKSGKYYILRDACATKEITIYKFEEVEIID